MAYYLSRTKIIDGLKYMLALAILVTFMLGLFIVITVPFELAKMADARTWPSREGTVTHSLASRTGSIRRSDYWEPLIRGTYDDTGEAFWISKVQYGEFRLGNGQSRSVEQVAKYPVGSKVQVYYPPSHPRDTILEPFASWDHLLVMGGIGVGFALLPFALYIYGRLTSYQPE